MSVANFLFVAYKPDCDEYCRGVRMGGYSSDFFIEHWLNEEQLVDRWAKYLLKNMTLDPQEEPYQISVYKNAEPMWTDDGVDSPDDLETEPAKWDDYVNWFRTKAETAAKAQLKADLEAAAAKLIEKKRQQDEERRAERKRQLELLKIEFE